MNFLIEKIKNFYRILTINLLSRLKQNIIWRVILKDKNIKYLAVLAKNFHMKSLQKKLEQ